MQVYPNYFPHFRCIADACRHSCCIGWEIDVDEASLERYRRTSGRIGEKLRRCISCEGDAHFVLGEGERCPFLNERNLCELILELGEDSLCDICREHPRFYNRYGNRLEVGLGLTCEAAGALILGWREPVCLLGTDAEEDDELLVLRDRVIALLQDRTHPLEARVATVWAFCGVEAPQIEADVWRKRFLLLERLEPAWGQRLERLGGLTPADLQAFSEHVVARSAEYEQLLVYFIYRHLANAEDGADLLARIAFAQLAYRMLVALGAEQWKRTGDFTFADQVELARLYSSEIEYSEENTKALLSALKADFWQAE